MNKRFTLSAALCALALAAAGCGDDEDNQALSYDETGTEISQICEDFEGADADLTGEAANDAEALGPYVEEFEGAVEQVRDLDVNEELVDERDEFVDNAEQQIAIIRDAEGIAQEGDQKAYVAKVRELGPLDAESDSIASRLGAEGCLQD